MQEGRGILERFALKKLGGRLHRESRYIGGHFTIGKGKMLRGGRVDCFLSC